MQVRPSLHFTSLRFTSPHCSSLHLTALHFTAQTCTDDMHLISPARRAIDHLRTRFSTLSHSTNLHLSAQEHNAMSSSAPSPMREAPPSPSATTNRSPACQSAPPEPPQAANTSPTHLRRLSDYIALTKQNTTSVLALTCLTILIAALIEDPPAHLLSGYALIAALVGVLCAGSGIWAVLKLEEGAEAGVLRWSPDLEDVWGRVWRWVTDQWGKGVDEGRALCFPQQEPRIALQEEHWKGKARRPTPHIKMCRRRLARLLHNPVRCLSNRYTTPSPTIRLLTWTTPITHLVCWVHRPCRHGSGISRAQGSTSMRKS